MSDFAPQLNDYLTIEGKQYFFAKHEAATGINTVYVAEGAKGRVYRLNDSDNKYYALKVFKDHWRLSENQTQNGALKQYYQDIPGVTVADRKMLINRKHKDLILQFPELEFAILMPWISGENWQNFWIEPNKFILSTESGLDLARKLASILVDLESSRVAHCDLAGSNIMIDAATHCVELIDIEDSYLPNIVPPNQIVRGTDGYYHRTSRRSGQWSSYGDRFASAILFAELMAWPIQEVRAAVEDNESYFEDDDLREPQLSNQKFKLLQGVLKSSSQKLAELFSSAWQASTLEECPPLEAWYDELQAAKIAKFVPTSLDIPQVRVENQTVHWSTVQAAEYYQVQIIFPGDDAPLLYEVSPSAAEYKINGQLQAVRVRACSGQRFSAWSIPIPIGALQKPHITIEDLPDGTGKQIEWDHIPGVSKYTRGTAAKTATKPTTRATFRYEGKAPGNYQFRVTAQLTFHGQEFTSSAIAEIQLLPETPRWNLATIEATPEFINLQWTPSMATEYHVYYQKEFVPIENKQVVNSPDVELQLSPGNYEFFVTAVYEGIESNRSESLIRAIPSIQSPIWVDEPQIQDGVVTLRWTDVLVAQPGDFRYQLSEINNRFEPVVLDNNAHRLALAPGDYTFQVAIIDKSGVQHSSSPAKFIQVQVNQSTILGPVECSINDEVTIQWLEVTGATHYYLNHHGTQDQPRRTADRYKCNEPQRRFKGIFSISGKHVFTVEACFGDLVGPKSALHTITVFSSVDEPRLKSRQIVARRGEEVRLVWSKSKKAEQISYEIQCALNPEFSHDVSVFTTDERAIAIDTTVSGTFYYRVRACREKQVSNWVEAIVEVAFSGPVIKACIASGSGSFITWEPVENANTYCVCHSPSPEFLDIETTRFETTSVFLDAEWISGYVRVQAIGGDYSVSTEIPVTETLPAPNWGSAIFTAEVHHDTVLYWQSDFDLWMPKFSIEIASTPDFSMPSTYIVDVNMLSVQLEEYGRYFARVHLCRDQQTSEWSEIAEIIVLSPAPSGLTLKSNSKGLKAEWDSIEAAQEYEIEWSTGKSFIASSDTGGIWITDNAYTQLAVPSGKIFVRVRALIDDTLTNWSRVVAVLVKRKPLQKPILQVSRQLDFDVNGEYMYLCQWQEIPGADHYRLERLTPNLECLWDGTETGQIVALPVGEIALRVVASEGYVETESASEIMNIIVTPSCPLLSVNVVERNVIFRWTTVAVATSYWLYARFVNTQQPWTRKSLAATASLEQQYTQQNVRTGTYECYVIARDEASGLESAPSAVVEFILK
ncbi:MAG: hypothetical protein ABI947_03420 [Chloroflexota bacterium]